MNYIYVTYSFFCCNLFVNDTSKVYCISISVKSRFINTYIDYGSAVVIRRTKEIKKSSKKFFIWVRHIESGFNILYVYACLETRNTLNKNKSKHTEMHPKWLSKFFHFNSQVFLYWRCQNFFCRHSRIFRSLLCRHMNISSSLHFKSKLFQQSIFSLWVVFWK